MTIKYTLSFSLALASALPGCGSASEGINVADAISSRTSPQEQMIAACNFYLELKRDSQKVDAALEKNGWHVKNFNNGDKSYDGVSFFTRIFYLDKYDLSFVDAQGLKKSNYNYDQKCIMAIKVGNKDTAEPIMEEVAKDLSIPWAPNLNKYTNLFTEGGGRVKSVFYNPVARKIYIEMKSPKPNWKK